jgi:hypothetical protein
MSRVAAILLGILASGAAAIADAFAGFCTEIHWPLSPANFDYTLCRGLALAAIAAPGTTTVLALVPKDRIWQSLAIAIGATLLVAFAVMWLDVVSSLG